MPRLLLALHVDVTQAAGELVLVDVLVLRDVFVGAVGPRAARGPPEETLLLVRAATRGQSSPHLLLTSRDQHVYRNTCRRISVCA